MKKLLFALLLLPALAWGQTENYDTLYPDANGTDLNADDNNTAGCATTANNWDRVDAASLADTVSFDSIAAVCNTGSKRECYTLTAFTRSHDRIDSVRIRAQMMAAVATDSARLYMRYGTDTVWSSRFAVSTAGWTEYEFARAQPPDGADAWDNAYVNGLEIGWEARLNPGAANGRVWLTYIRAVVRSEPGGASAPSEAGAVRFYFPSTGDPPDTIPFGHGLTTKWSDTVSAGDWGMARRHKLVIHTASNTAMASWIDSAHTAVGLSTVCYGQWVSDLMAYQTFLGTFKGQMKGRESANAANGWLCIAMYLIDKNGNSLGQLIAPTFPDATTAPPEFTTTATNRQFMNTAESPTVSMTGALTGPDSCRLVVEVGVRENSTTASHNYTLRVGDPTDSSDLAENQTQTSNGRPWLELREGPALYQSGLSTTTLYPSTGNNTFTAWVTDENGLLNCGTSNKYQWIDDLSGGGSSDDDATYLNSTNATALCFTGPGSQSINLDDLSVGAEDSIIKVAFHSGRRGLNLESADSTIMFATTAAAVQKNMRALTPAPSSYTRDSVVFTNRPNGGNWTDAAVDSIEIGMTSFNMASTNEENRWTWGYAVVYWKDMPASEGNERRQRLKRTGIMRLGEYEDEKDRLDLRPVFSDSLLGQ